MAKFKLIASCSAVLLASWAAAACSGSEDVDDAMTDVTDDDVPTPGPADDDAMADDDDTMADDMPADDDVPAADDDTPEPTVNPDDGMLMADFDGWDGATELTMWTFEFGDPEMPYTAGFFELTDMTGDYMLAMVDGAEGSQYALSFSNSMATDWGGGVGFYMGEVDLTSFSGVSFWVRGSTPVGTMGVGIGRPETDDDCVAELATDCARSSHQFTVPEEWTQIQLTWDDFTAGVGVGGETYELPPPNMTGLSFSAHMVYAPNADGEYVPAPGAFEIAIDDIIFF